MTCIAGLSGLEHVVGIPGTLGGLVSMNGGSQRKSISEVVEWVRAVDRDGHIRVLSKNNCGFSYRHSVFQDTDLIIVEAALQLQYSESRIIHSNMLHNLRKRRSRFPLHLPNCGSIFRSTPEMYETIGSPGKIIEELQLKGCKIGGAEISRKHANFIVNKGRAKAQDVLRLIEIVRKRAEALQVDLRCEVLYADVDGTIRCAEEAG
jgi:UDP-N-acetylmuramate dehydrogenase